MAQFKAYANPNKSSQKTYPYLLDIQSNLLEDLRTRVVIPLSPVALAGKAAITKLCPVLDVAGEPCVAITQQIAGIDRKALGKEVCNLSAYRGEILDALDLIIAGI